MFYNNKIWSSESTTYMTLPETEMMEINIYSSVPVMKVE